MKIAEYLTDFLNLMYPRTCSVCNCNLLSFEKLICTKCVFDMPRTNFHLEQTNPVHQIFWGRTSIEYATALFYFRKGSNYQNLIHNLKYNGMKEIGLEMGKYFGKEIENSEFANIDAIVPIPLHPSRERKRGYNQSEWIGKGLAESLNKSIVTNLVYRNTATSTQTQKSREERWNNVSSIFSLQDYSNLNYKHILLVDDVITTGATIEACANKILEIPGIKVSIASLGFASN